MPTKLKIIPKIPTFSTPIKTDPQRLKKEFNLINPLFKFQIQDKDYLEQFKQPTREYRLKKGNIGDPFGRVLKVPRTFESSIKKPSKMESQKLNNQNNFFDNNIKPPEILERYDLTATKSHGATYARRLTEQYIHRNMNIGENIDNNENDKPGAGAGARPRQKARVNIREVGERAGSVPTENIYQTYDQIKGMGGEFMKILESATAAQLIPNTIYKRVTHGPIRETEFTNILNVALKKNRASDGTPSKELIDFKIRMGIYDKDIEEYGHKYKFGEEIGDY